MVGLREQAELDMRMIMQDVTGGFGYDFTITSPAGVTQPMVGFSNDIGQVIDLDTGQVLSGRDASVAFPIGQFREVFPGGTYPRGTADASVKPWVVVFDSINGVSQTFKVSQSYPDRALGVYVCKLELYKP